MATHRGKLNDRQARFVKEYLKDLNGMQAAIRAGYSKVGAGVEACRMLKSPKIKAEVEKALDARAARTEVTVDRVVEELALLAFVNIDDYATHGPDGIRLKPMDEMPEEAGRAIASLSETVAKDGGTVRFNLHSKTKALELLSKHLGMLTDRVQIEGGQGPVQFQLIAADPKAKGTNGNGRKKKPKPTGVRRIRRTDDE